MYSHVLCREWVLTAVVRSEAFSRRIVQNVAIGAIQNNRGDPGNSETAQQMLPRGKKSE